MSFASPLVLIALLAVPVLIWLYGGQQRRRAEAAAAFVNPILTESVVPKRPRWRRHVPMLAFLIAIAALIVAAARPQTTSAVPLRQGAIMLAQDVSSSMRSTDVSPSRLGAAQRAASRFVASVPSSFRVGLIQFNQKATVLQSPSTDHSLTRDALTQLRADGHTAVGDAIAAAAHSLNSIPQQEGKRIPSAIVLLSDGTSDFGSDPIGAARKAGSQHIPIYTIALGTGHGTIAVPRGRRTVQTPVPLSAQQLQQIAKASGGRAFTANDTAGLRAIYKNLAAQLGHKQVKNEITASFAGVALALLLVGSLLTLRWFGRLI
jgi:Ca-activated chloride channel family protein